MNKRYLYIFIIFFMVTGLFGNALAAGPAPKAKSGAELVKECSGAGGSASAGFILKAICASYISGIIEAYDHLRPHLSESVYCPPEKGIEIDRAMNDFLVWMEAHRKAADRPAYESVFHSLSGAYPCNKEK